MKNIYETLKKEQITLYYQLALTKNEDEKRIYSNRIKDNVEIMIDILNKASENKNK